MEAGRTAGIAFGLFLGHHMMASWTFPHLATLGVVTVAALCSSGCELEHVHVSFAFRALHIIHRIRRGEPRRQEAHYTVD